MAYGSVSWRSKNWVSLKVLTSDAERTIEAARERDTLVQLRDRNPDHPGHRYIIHLLDSFYHEGPNGQHMCLVYKAMGEPLGIFQNRLADKRLPLLLTKRVSRQLLHALDHIHSCGFVHTGRPLRVGKHIRLMPSRYLQCQHIVRA